MSRDECACGPCESSVPRGGPCDPPELCQQCQRYGCRREGRLCLTPAEVGESLDRCDEQRDLEGACRVAAELLESHLDPRCIQVAECLRGLLGGES